MTQEQELALIRRVQAGETEAFEDLVRAHEKTVYNLALRMTGDAQDAEDMAQEAFLKAYRSLGEFRGDSRFIIFNQLDSHCRITKMHILIQQFLAVFVCLDHCQLTSICSEIL